VVVVAVVVVVVLVHESVLAVGIGRFFSLVKP
jgi:hypothetical protein